MAQRQFRSDDTSIWVDRYGQGVDGALTVSGSTTFSPNNASCSGTAGGTTLTLGAAGSFANGDLLLIHQTRGSGVGNWELNKITSGGGTTTLTLAYELINTYTDSGSSQAQVVELKEYTSVTINSAVTLSASTWGGDTGGILAFLCNGTTNIQGSISATAKGFRGFQPFEAGSTGEGTDGAGAIETTSPNGNGGGGHTPRTDPYRGGGGGGNGAAGEVGQGGSNAGQGGNAVGNVACTNINFGGAGGSGANDGTGGGATIGLIGGGIIMIFSKNITVSGAVANTGQTPMAAGGASNSGGGGGAGGSILLKGQTISIGTNLITAPGGSPNPPHGGSSNYGGTGGVGRIHIDYSQSLTGTTSPTLDSTVDAVLNDLPAEQNYTLLM